MNLNIKKLREGAIIPQYATVGSACFDLCANIPDPIHIKVGWPKVIPTGLSFEIPDGMVMLVFGRSGAAFKNDTRLANCVGVIDSDYRGEVMVKLARDMSSTNDLIIQPGDRIAQAMLVATPRATLVEVTSLSETERGNGGFGSTGV